MAGASSALRDQPFDRALAARRKSSSLRSLPSSVASRHLAPRPGPAQRAGRSGVREPMARKQHAFTPLAGEGLAVRATGLTHPADRSEEHTSELQSLMRISYAVFCLQKKK